MREARRSSILFPRLAALCAALCLSFSLTFFSCQNSSDNTMMLLAYAQAAAKQKANGQTENPSPAPNPGAKKTVTFTGTVSGSDGAYPAKAYSKAITASVSKSARPDLDTDEGGGYEWFATATADGAADVQGVFETEEGRKRNFTMGLEIGKSWTIVCGIRVVGGGTVMSDSFGFEPDEDDPVFSHTFVPVPKKSGNGSIALNVAVDSAVVKATAICAEQEWIDAAGAKEKALTISGTISGTNATLSIASIKSGAYDVTLNFFTDDGAGAFVFVYSIDQKINVFDNASTNMWFSSGGMGKVQTDSEGKTALVVDQSEIKAYSPTVLYIGDTTSAGAEGAKSPSDQNPGNAYEPLATMAAAVKIIEATASAENKKDYKIYVSGTVTSANVSDNAIFSDSLDGKATGVTLCGLGSSDVIDAASTGGSVITVNTSVPITIKKLTVTGGNASGGEGGGIYMDPNTTVTLESGAVVAQNRAKFHGGGIYLGNGAQLVIKSGAVVSQNSTTNNNEGSGGLAICADGGKVVMQGGEICGNTFGSSEHDNIKGAVRLQNGSELLMSGGTISGNSGNAVWVSTDSSFSVKGSASVPYDETNKKNDIYLEQKTDGSYPAVQIAGAFSPNVSQGKLAICAPGWKRKQAVVMAGAGVSDISACKNYFEPTGNGIHINLDEIGNKKLNLAAPYYVAQDGADSDETPGTKEQPYKTLKFACKQISGGGTETIYVDGTLIAEHTVDDLQTLPKNLDGGGTFDTTKCSALTIEGVGDNPTIDANKKGTALNVVTAVPITIKNIKITGGSNTGSDGKGGGILVASGASVTLGTGGVIAGNEAFKGGGVYVDGNFTLDGGTIGDASKNEHATYSQYSNRATGSDNVGGGIFFSDTGKVAIKSGIIAYNFAYRGGGIASRNGSYNANSQLAIEGGKIRYNGASGDDGGYNCFSLGGGVFANGSKLSFSGGEIYGNYGVDGGGGLFLEQTNDAVMSGGTVHDNEYHNSSNKWGTDIVLFDAATLSMTGGKVYSASQKDYGVHVRSASCNLKMSGEARVGEKTPVLLGQVESGVTTCTQITIAGDLTAPEDGSKNAYIVPIEWNRGLQVLTATGSGAANLIKDNASRFGTIDEDFEVKQKGETASGVLNAPIYVASATTTGAGARKVCSGAPSSGSDARGTKAKPYATMKQAVVQLTDADVDYEIRIDGTIKGGANVYTPINSSAQAASVLITGVNADNANDVLDGDTLNSIYNDGSVLVLNKDIPVTIKDLQITGGNASASGHGGGIYVGKGSVCLDDGALVSKNNAITDGGGVYVRTGASLYMCGTARVGSPTTPDSAPASADDAKSAGGNTADSGAGIYSKGKVYLGYSGKDSEGNLVAKTLAGGVIGNFAASEAGGINCAGGTEVTGLVEFASGNVSYNAGGIGGIAIAEGQTVNMTGGTIKGNALQTAAVGAHGGAVFVNGTFKMSGTANIPYGGAEGKNDVYLYDEKKITIAGSLTAPSAGSPNATITPSKWTRKATVVLDQTSAGLVGGNITKFATTDSGEDCFEIKPNDNTTPTLGVIDAPIIVAAVGSGYDASKARGTANSPYETISDAISGAVDSLNKEITVKGTVGKQEISSWPTSGDSASVDAVTVKGKNSDAKIDAASDGSAFTMNKAGKTVTIKDLTLTGGNGSDLTGGSLHNGGGIYLNAGTVKLADGAVVTGNSAITNGGGVFLAGSGAALFMYGKSLIGDSAISTTRAAGGTSKHANKATVNGGGIYNNGGSVYIGYDAAGHEEPVYSDASSCYGVRRNYATNMTGGIHNASGTLLIASGDISYNAVQNSAYGSPNAGGIYCGGGTVTISGGTIKENFAKQGGGLFVKSGASATVNGDVTIQGNEAGESGGAVYNGGTLTLGGDTYIPAGSGEKYNDVYLASSKTIAIASNLAKHNNSDNQIAVTMQSYGRGITYKYLSSTTSLIGPSTAYKFKFTQDDADWEKLTGGTASNSYAYITSPVYVVGSSSSGSTKPEGFGWGVADGAFGTKSKPYASIAQAAASGELANAKVPNTITIAGTLAGAQKLDAADATDAWPDALKNADQLNITGYIASGDTTSAAKLDAEQYPGIVPLLVNCSDKSKPVINITNLKITGGRGNMDVPGGGIELEKGTVKLGNGVNVAGNYGVKGGGVCVKADGTLFVTGSAIIGDSEDAVATGYLYVGQTGEFSCSNGAEHGGGIYAEGKVYVGCNASGVAAAGFALDDGAGIMRNYAGEYGGGVYVPAGGQLVVASGSISNNAVVYDYASGGGLKVDGTAAISGGTFSGNAAGAGLGGAVCVKDGGSVTVSGGAAFTKNTAAKGGAVYNSGTFAMTAGSIGAGTAATANKALGDDSAGGAIYQNGTLNISGSAVVYPGSEKANDVYLADDSGNVKAITIDAEYSGSGNTDTSKMSVTPANWKRGMPILAGTSLDTTNSKYFALTDAEWSVLNTDAENGKIDSDFWVSQDAISGVTDGVAGNNDTGNGSKARPYATIQKAATETWREGKAVINVNGTIKAASASALQEIPADGVTATSITLQGKNSAVINANSKGSALTINKAIPVTLSAIEITGGQSSQGAGLNIAAAASVQMLSNTKIYSNKSYGSVERKGAGVYIAEGAKLSLGYGSLIYSNTPYDTSKQTLGGGVYNDGTITLSQGEIYGNSASYGGGIYNSEKGEIKIGGSVKIGETSANTAVGGSGRGGAIYNAGTFNVTSSGWSIPYGDKPTANSNDVAIYWDSENSAYKMIGGSSGFSASVAITPTEWHRGKQVTSLTINSTNLVPTDPDFTVMTDATHKGKLNGDIYIGGYSSGTISGSSTHPYTTFAAALAETWSQKQKIIMKVEKAGELVSLTSETVPSDVTALEIAGYMEEGATTASYGLHANNKGTAITLNMPDKSFTLTLTDLQVKYGKNTDSSDGNGGGIKITKGTVKLCGTTKVYSNEAKKGGGVYVSANGVLFMKEKALIGDLTQTTASSSGRSNYASGSEGGGGIYSDGEVYIGYDGFDEEGNPKESAMTAGYGVRRNYALNGGGIYCNKGTLCLLGASVSYNYASYSSGYYGGGGGIATSDNSSTTKTINAKDALFAKNGAQKYGGAICLGKGASANIEACAFGGGDGLQNFVDGTSTSEDYKAAGGAIYHLGEALEFKGAVTFTSASEKSNDIQLVGTGSGGSSSPYVFRSVLFAPDYAAAADAVPQISVKSPDNYHWKFHKALRASSGSLPASCANITLVSSLETTYTLNSKGTLWPKALPTDGGEYALSSRDEGRGNDENNFLYKVAGAMTSGDNVTIIVSLYPLRLPDDGYPVVVPEGATLTIKRTTEDYNAETEAGWINRVTGSEATQDYCSLITDDKNTGSIVLGSPDGCGDLILDGQNKACRGSLIYCTYRNDLTCYNVAFKNGDITGGYTSGDRRGGAINYGAYQKNLKLYGCVIDNCKASLGGAIAGSANFVTLDSACVIKNCSASGADTANNYQNCSVFYSSCSNATITPCLKIYKSSYQGKNNSSYAIHIHNPPLGVSDYYYEVYFDGSDTPERFQSAKNYN